MTQFKFKLLTGGHREEVVSDNGSTTVTDYVRGDVFLSEHRLDEKFGRNKFELLGDMQQPKAETPITPKAATVLPAEAQIPATEAPASPVTPEAAPEAQPQPKPAEAVTEADMAEAGEANPQPGSDIGTEVTANYDDAAVAGVQVFEKAGWFSIYKEGKRLNDKALRKNEIGIELDQLADATKKE